MKKPRNERADELRPEYDLRRLLRGGIRGKYAKRYHAGTNLILLDPEIRKAFRDERAVNDALRLVVELRKIGVGRSRSTFVPEPRPNKALHRTRQKTARR